MWRFAEDFEKKLTEKIVRKNEVGFRQDQFSIVEI